MVDALTVSNSSSNFSPERLKEESLRLESLTPEERIKQAVSWFDGHVAMSSSFGAQSAVSLHMITKIQPDIPVILVDTGYLFAETLSLIHI